MKSKSFWIGVAVGIAAVGFAYYAASQPMDFRVYHVGARGVFDGSRPVYGPESGLGWPMHYRYPPLFLLLFAPFAALPMSWGAALWVTLKIGALIWLVPGILGPRKNSTPAAAGVFSSSQISFLAVLFMTPYLVEELRYGNAQFFVFALTAAALLIAKERPVLSAGSLALAISLKVWPLFFVPYLAARGDWKPVAYTLAFVALFAFVPSVYFGVGGNLNLLSQWFVQESQTQFGESEIWFPNQSLRGVLMRYLTVIDYSKVPDANYPLVHIAAWDSAVVRMIWLVVAGAVYAGFLVMTYRSRQTDGWIEHGLGFGLLPLLQPFTQKYAMSVLLWPAIVAGSLVKKTRLRILIYMAVILVWIQPLTPGANAQRLYQVLGLDFGAAVLLIGPVALLQARMRSGRIL